MPGVHLCEEISHNQLEPETATDSGVWVVGCQVMYEDAMRFRNSRAVGGKLG